MSNTSTTPPTTANPAEPPEAASGAVPANPVNPVNPVKKPIRLWVIFVLAIAIGLLGGWLGTVAELGFWPSGGSDVAFGLPPIIPPEHHVPGPAPKAVVPETVFEFGGAERGVMHRHAFTIKNEGQGPLTIEGGESTCICTVAEFKDKTIAPGASTEVIVQWHWEKLEPFRRSTEIRTNDPDRPTIELTVSGEIVSKFRMTPEGLTFASIPPKEKVNGELRLYSFETKDLALETYELSDASTAESFEVKSVPMTAEQLKEEAGAKSGCLVTVTVKPGLPAGVFQQRIQLHLNLPTARQVEVLVQGKVNSPIEVVSPLWHDEEGVLMLGAVSSKAGTKANLFLIIRGPQEKLNVKVASVDPDTLKVSMGQTQKLQAGVTKVPLAIEIPPGSHPVNHLGSKQATLARIFIDTGLDEPKQLRLLVSYSVED